MGVVASVVLAACDAGLAPPREAFGTIVGTVRYTPPDAWPPADSLRDLRFVAMRFIPQDTSDFLQLNRLVFSERLPTNVAADTFVVSDVPTGRYLYSGIAQQYSPALVDWRPLGVYTAGDGFFDVGAEDTVRLALTVDFRNLPPFPPR